MAKLTMDWEDGPVPKCGDLFDFPKTRYMVLRVKPVKRRDPAACPRFHVWAKKLPELSERQIRLFAGHAHRHGGQRIFPCYWNSRKKKTFEDLMKPQPPVPPPGIEVWPEHPGNSPDWEE